MSLPKTYKAAVINSPGGNFEIVEKNLEVSYDDRFDVKLDHPLISAFFVFSNQQPVRSS